MQDQVGGEPDAASPGASRRPTGRETPVEQLTVAVSNAALALGRDTPEAQDLVAASRRITGAWSTMARAKRSAG